MKKLILLRGLPGCGKTSLAEFLRDGIGGDRCVAFAADDYFTDINGDYNFDVKKLGVAHLWCRSQVMNNMAMEVPVIIVHNTLTTPKEIKEYTNMADIRGYQVVSLIVENRHGSTNIHNVPEETLVKMKERFDVQLI